MLAKPILVYSPVIVLKPVGMPNSEKYYYTFLHFIRKNLKLVFVFNQPYDSFLSITYISDWLGFRYVLHEILVQ